jgi:hypothetical protein
MLEIVACKLHWLCATDAGVHDLCAHGGVRVSLDGELLVDDPNAYAVSTGGLHLLRTVEADHFSSRIGVGDDAEHLIPNAAISCTSPRGRIVSGTRVARRA